jgi:hypothetical protein
MTGLRITVKRPTTNQVFGNILVAGRRRSTPYLILDGVTTALVASTMVRSNLTGDNVAYQPNTRPLRGAYGAYYRVISVFAATGIAGTAAQLVDRFRNTDELSVYGPIGDNTSKVVSSVISDSVLTIMLFRSAIRGKSGKYPLSGVGRVSVTLSAVKNAVGVYDGVRELLSRPEVQRALGVAAGYTVGTLARLRAKLPFGNKEQSFGESLSTVEALRQEIDETLADESLDADTRMKLEILVMIAESEPAVFEKLARVSLEQLLSPTVNDES